MTRRAQLACDTLDSLRDDTLNVFFTKTTTTLTLLEETFTDLMKLTQRTSVTSVTIPYIKGTSETISRILQPYNIRVAHKHTTTLRQLLTNVKVHLTLNFFFPPR